jgi:antitoxin HigA-1
MSKLSTITDGHPGVPIHPGRILAAEMEARGLNAHALALRLRVSPDRITRICKGERELSADTAIRLGRFFGTGPQLWVNLQANYELAVAWRDGYAKIAREVDAA